MPRHDPTFIDPSLPPEALWTTLVDLVEGQRSQGPHRGFGPSIVEDTLRRLMQNLGPERMSEVFAEGLRQARVQPQGHETLRTAMQVLAETQHRNGYVPRLVDHLAHRTPRSMHRDVWHRMMVDAHPALADDLLNALPMLRWPTHMVDDLVQGIPPHAISMTVHRLHRDVVDQIAPSLNPWQQAHLFGSPRVLTQIPVEHLTLLMRHLPDLQVEGMLDLVTRRLDGEARTEAFDRLVTAVGPTRLTSVLDTARQAQQARDPGSAPPAWTVALSDHLLRRPPTVSIDDLIDEANELKAMGPDLQPTPGAVENAPRAR